MPKVPIMPYEDKPAYDKVSSMAMLLAQADLYREGKIPYPVVSNIPQRRGLFGDPTQPDDIKDDNQVNDYFAAKEVDAFKQRARR